MKAWQVHAAGEAESMSLEEIRLPEPGPGQVRIKVESAGLNFFDILQIQGKYQVRPPFPFTPGAEVSGSIDAIGPNVDAFFIGDPVIALCFQGGFAEYAIAEAARTFPKPEGMPFPEAATFSVVYQTSYFALKDRAALHASEWLLVHAGASGVGASAIQLGKAFGARVIATAGSDAKLAFCRELGADETLLYNDPKWVDAVKRITGGRGADVIYDPVGGAIFDLSTKCIAPGGRLLVIGFASGQIPTIAANRILLKNISIVGAVWGGHVQIHPSYPAEAHGALTKLFKAGQILPPKPTIYPLADGTRALRDLASRVVVGKAALAPG